MRPLFCLLLGGLSALSADLPNGYDNLILGRNTSSEVTAAAGHLADFLELDFGKRPQIRHLPLAGRPDGILISADPGNSRFDFNALTDEILIERTKEGLSISGTDNTATCFAIYRFIERYLGWRCYAPGQLGLEKLDDPPQPPAGSGEPEILLYEKAKFYSRNLSGMSEGGHSINWRTWHGLRERFVFNHTLQQTLSPDLFESHPDWFAKDKQGKPMKPPFNYSHGYNDHPDLSHPDVRSHVVQVTIDALEASNEPAANSVYPPVLRSPGVISTSISLGDSFVFGQFPDSYSWNPDAYFRRWPDWANHVFDYSNEVAGRVKNWWYESFTRQSSDASLYIGALSYLNWENVPDFKVDRSIVPYLTYDRSQWYDPNARENDLALVSTWSTNGPEFLGTWDYLFGYGFLMPRSMVSIIGDSIPSLYDRGVRAYFSQVAAIWPYDAHTNYLAAQLLWDPDADVESLMHEFFNEYYGPASPQMRAFFSKAEAVWMNQAESGWWLRYWKDPWQAALWQDNDLFEMQRLLELAAANSSKFDEHSYSTRLKPSRFHNRIRETAQLFNLTRLFVEYQKSCWKLQSHAWENASRKELRSGLKTVEECHTLRENLRSSAAHISIASPRINYAGELEWVFRYDALDATRKVIETRLEKPSSIGADLTDYSVLKDKYFRKIDDPRIWHHQFMDSENHSRIVPRGGRGYLVKDTRRGHLYQLFRAEEGYDYLALLDLETAQSPTGEVYLEMDFFNAGNDRLGKSPRARIAPSGIYGEKQRIRSLMRAPAGSAYGRIKIRFYELDPGSQVKLEQIDVLELEPTGP